MSAAAAGYAVVTVVENSRASARVRGVERSTRRRLTRGTRSMAPVRSGQASADGRESALSAAQRICCSIRRRSDCSSTATIAGSTGSTSTTSMNPRAGRRAATSTSRFQRGLAAPRTASPIGAWKRSWMRGPVFGYRWTLRSAPSTRPIATSTAKLGSRMPASIWLRYPWSTPAAAATALPDSPASSRSRLISRPTRRRISAASRPVEVL